MANVNNLSDDKWSSDIDQIYLENANDYEKKCYENRYFLAFEKAIRPLLSYYPESKPLTVLDAATGTGAGAAYIHEQLKAAGRQDNFFVTGVDLNKKAITHAKSTWGGLANLLFKQQDIIEAVQTSPSVYIKEKSAWDIVISMETIEHIPSETMHSFLQAVSDNLAPGGKAIFSCPRLRPRESTKKRPGHINELYFQQFSYTLGEYFPMVELYSFDRYGCIVPHYPDCNLQVGVVSMPPRTAIFT